MRAADLRAEECEQLIALHPSETDLRNEIAQQFTTLHNRAQLLLGICGVLLTASVLITTGRIIGHGRYSLEQAAGVLLSLAGLCDIVSTAICVGGVLHIRWLTQMHGEDIRIWIMRALAHRDRKTHAYHAALAILLVSMMFYQAAVLIVVMQL